jgi:hypothetical protein
MADTFSFGVRAVVRRAGRAIKGSDLYKESIPIADRRFEEHLKAIEKEEKKDR